MSQTEIVIIESRSATDHFEARQEGRILQQVLELEGIKSLYFEVIDMSHLKKAIKKAKSDKIKYVHFSCHGAEG